MAKKEVKNIGLSVRAKLLTLSKERNIDFNSILIQYFHERFLYRLSTSDYRNNFILKGALCFLAYDISRLRPTKDIDFLGKATANDLENIKKIMQTVTSIEVADGVIFNPKNITVERIKEDADYEGVRVKVESNLASVKIRIQLDIGFGDIVVAGPNDIYFPVLLGFPVPHISVYSRESMIAEKFQAIVYLNYTTSRLKDFYDIIFLAQSFEFELSTLKEAIKQTFSKRNTPLDGRKLVFSNEFKTNQDKQDMWLAFLKRVKIESNLNFSDTMGKICDFLDPVFTKEKGIWNPKPWSWE
ncbi:MAG: nucleotidyl transferase AbiEii/AbiGii toxin family protein [Candidatus Sericytochromatia bacterium]|nr:nucleotidyl transferase AbiEii/AbiGii toxin family protein [Candidatus Sericytochromatia bacterium]